MLWLLLARVELLSFNKNEISNIPVAAPLWQEEPQCQFWRDSFFFLFSFWEPTAFHRGEPLSIPVLFSPTATLCRHLMFLCRFTKPTLSLPQTNICFWFVFSTGSVYVSVFMTVCQCVYASVTLQEWPKLHHMQRCMFRHLIAAGSFLVTIRPSLRDPQLQMSCIRFVVA